MPRGKIMGNVNTCQFSARARTGLRNMLPEDAVKQIEVKGFFDIAVKTEPVIVLMDIVIATGLQPIICLIWSVFWQQTQQKISCWVIVIA
jgi:hypothetical protein